MRYCHMSHLFFSCPQLGGCDGASLLLACPWQMTSMSFLVMCTLAAHLRLRGWSCHVTQANKECVPVLPLSRVSRPSLT